MSLRFDTIFPSNRLSISIENYKSLPSKTNQKELYDSFVHELIIQHCFFAIETTNISNSKYLALRVNNDLYVKVYTCTVTLEQGDIEFYKRDKIKSIFDFILHSNQFKGICFDYLDNKGYFISKEEIENLLLSSKNYLTEERLCGLGHLFEVRNGDTKKHEVGDIFKVDDYQIIDSLKFLSNGEFFNHFFVINFCSIIEDRYCKVFEYDYVYLSTKKYLIINLFKNKYHTPNEYMIRATHLFKVIDETDFLDGLCIKETDKKFVYIDKHEIAMLNKYFTANYATQRQEYDYLVSKNLLEQRIEAKKTNRNKPQQNIYVTADGKAYATRTDSSFKQPQEKPSFIETVSELVKSKASNSNAKHLKTICEKLIDDYEGNGMYPSCKEDLMHSVSLKIKACKSEIASWEDYNTDYIKIAHSMLANLTFDLLASGHYHIYAGVLNPMSCSHKLMNVYKKCMEYALTNKIIDEKTHEEQLQYLRKCISEIG